MGKKQPWQMTRDEFGSAYHGTNEEFEQFKLNRTTGAQGLTSKYGVWFTSDPDEAVQYAQLAGKRNYQNQEQYEQRIDKLIKQSEKYEKQGNYDKAEQAMAEAEHIEGEMKSIEPKEIVKDVALPKHIMTHDSVEVFNSTEMVNVIEDAISKGYEGVKFTDISDSPFGLDRTTSQYIIFKPENISSISHKALVQQVLAEGKPVPPEVLAAYPDLAGSVDLSEPVDELELRPKKKRSTKRAKPKKKRSTTATSVGGLR